MTQAERITALEVKVAALEGKVDQSIEKLDDLLALRNRGIGAFWLASAVLGTGIVGAIVSILNWLKG